MNPMQFLQSIMSGGMKNPQQMAMEAIKQSSMPNPMINNLIEMANKNDFKGVENFARNVFKERGMDFDSEFNKFMQDVRGQKNQTKQS